ncbi:TPA: hypothetical protein QCO88_001711 [Bacillus cereus]|uniref:hypothetical protein n=1 Tax=Bacillus sp. FSL M8-0139 TaxID=2921613 RepID=UPI0030F50EEB|nr:hypothetical protein [Bacillus cereus]
MILPQLMIDIESSRERHVEYDVEVETISGKKAIFTIKLSDFGHESKIQEQVTCYLEDAEDKNEFAIFNEGVSLRIGDIVYIKINEGSDLPF